MRINKVKPSPEDDKFPSNGFRTIAMTDGQNLEGLKELNCECFRRQADDNKDNDDQDNDNQGKIKEIDICLEIVTIDCINGKKKFNEIAESLFSVNGTPKPSWFKLWKSLSIYILLFTNL